MFVLCLYVYILDCIPNECFYIRAIKRMRCFDPHKHRNFSIAQHFSFNYGLASFVVRFYHRTGTKYYFMLPTANPQMTCRKGLNIVIRAQQTQIKLMTPQMMQRDHDRRTHMQLPTSSHITHVHSSYITFESVTAIENIHRLYQ